MCKSISLHVKYVFFFYVLAFLYKLFAIDFAMSS